MQSHVRSTGVDPSDHSTLAARLHALYVISSAACAQRPGGRRRACRSVDRHRRTTTWGRFRVIVGADVEDFPSEFVGAVTMTMWRSAPRRADRDVVTVCGASASM